MDAMPAGIALPDDGGRLELPGTEGGHISAVIRRRADGSIAWQALPSGGDGDAWVKVALEGDSVVANSWSCFRVVYDLNTGSETARHFTKYARGHQPEAFSVKGLGSGALAGRRSLHSGNGVVPGSL